MHLLYATNDSYVPHVATTLISVFENNPDMQFIVHVMATDISENNYQKLYQMVEQYGHQLEIKIIHPEDLEIDLSICGHWGIFPSLKLYAADLFSEVDMMLYMDADMICIGSIKSLEEIDMTDYYVAAAPDEAACQKHKARLSIPQNEFYGNGGFMYLNLKKWRKDNMRQQCFSFFNDPSNAHIIKFAEQDVINKICQGHIYQLSIEWNMAQIYWLHHQQAVPKEYKKDISSYRKKAIIIHYIDACKPWFRDCRFPLKKYYFKYAAMTPWGIIDYGYSKYYEGKWITFKTNIKSILHKLGIKKGAYCFDI